jgi:hypothetical protein
LAMAFMRGDKFVHGVKETTAVLTPRQARLLDVLWLRGRRNFNNRSPHRKYRKDGRLFAGAMIDLRRCITF